MNEQQYHVQVDQLFLDIEAWLEEHDVDFEYSESILTIFMGSSQLILSRQVALKEIWLASPKGAYHFRYCCPHWQTSRGESLFPLLAMTLEISHD